jgi:hypothetical protein
MSQTKFTFTVESLRKFADPNKPGRARHFAVCDTKYLPKNFPMETNPREQNLNSKVAKKIRESFLGEETGPIFHLLNRGLLISAEGVQYDNQTDEMTIAMSDPGTHGIVDGGHTYKIVTSEDGSLPEPRFVTLEVVTGIEDIFEKVAGARNTSVQVKEKSLAELEGRLEIVKNLIRSLPFENDVAYRENEDKPIDVQEVIAVLTIFHNELHLRAKDGGGKEMVHPVFAYSGKGRTLQVYLGNETSYEKLAPIAEKVFKLHDRVKRTFPKFMQELGARPGARKEFGYRKGKLHWPLYYSPKQNGEVEKMAVEIPAGFVYPVLGAMRFLVEEGSDGKYQWKADPLKLWDNELGKKLVELSMAASDELGRNPMAVGKSSRHWEGLYNYVAATYLAKKA